jgi:AcrR family transcriptional regulator
MKAVMARARATTVTATSATQQAPETVKMLALMEAAEDIFIAKGYHTATMSDVAKAAGMSKKTVYQLIESKAELFAHLLAHHQSKLVFPIPKPGATAKSILIDNLTCLAKFLLSPEQIAIVRLIMAEHTHSPDIGRVFHQNRFKKAKSKLEACLADFAARENITLENVSELSAMLFGMAIGEFHTAVLIGFRAPPGKAALESRIRQAIDIFAAGCGCSKTPAR